jgi:hypothetical protein
VKLDLGEDAIGLGCGFGKVILPHEPQALEPVRLDETMYCIEDIRWDRLRAVFHE